MTTYLHEYLVKDVEDGARRKEKIVFRTRLAIAVSAGLEMVVPMLGMELMSLHPSRVTSLIATSVIVGGLDGSGSGGPFGHSVVRS